MFYVLHWAPLQKRNLPPQMFVKSAWNNLFKRLRTASALRHYCQKFWFFIISLVYHSLLYHHVYALVTQKGISHREHCILLAFSFHRLSVRNYSKHFATINPHNLQEKLYKKVYQSTCVQEIIHNRYAWWHKRWLLLLLLFLKRNQISHNRGRS